MSETMILDAQKKEVWLQRIRDMAKAGVLDKSTAHFARPKSSDLLKRTERYESWRSARLSHEIWPFSRVLSAAPKAKSSVICENGKNFVGLNFASQDYLSLSNHDSIKEAAERALSDFGPHSAGSAILTGNTSLSLNLESSLSDFLQMEHVTLFPTGWAAGFGALVGLVRPHDHIVMDALAHACLQQGAYAATANVHRYQHNTIATLEEILTSIRASDIKGGILVITEGLFSMDSDIPDIGSIQELCRKWNATLLVDVAHDLGAIGPNGAGALGIQELLGKVDIVMGSFSKTFASNGGFVATHSHSARQYIKMFGGSHTFSNALSPVQCGIVSEAIRICRSAEGDERRSKLKKAVVAMRDELKSKNCTYLGGPSAIVPVMIGKESISRIASRLLQETDVLANVVEFPAVALGSSRFRLQVMSDHSPEQTTYAASVISDAIGMAESLLAESNFG